MAYNSSSGLPPMESLVAAVTAARLGSFSAAALELDVTHAAVSRRVATAEAWAGVRLFTRRGRGVSPTNDGQRALARLSLALEQIAQIGERPQRARRLPVVRLAVTPSFARFWLLPRLRDLEHQPTDIRIEVVADLTHADLASGEVDLAIRYGRGGWKIGPEDRLFEEPLYPVVSRALLSSRSMSAAEVLEAPLLHNGDTTNWRCWTAAHEVVFRPKPSDRLAMDYALTLDAASVGLGAALWNGGLHALSTVPPPLVTIPELTVLSPLRYFLLSRSLGAHTPAATIAERIRAAC